MAPLFRSRIAASQDNSKVLVSNEYVALGIGVPASIIGFWAAWHALGQVFAVFGHLVVFLIAAYVALLAVQFWTAKPYLGGMTKKEIKLTLLWPYGAVRYLRQGVRAARDQMPTSASYGTSTDPVVVSENSAWIYGMGVTILAAILLFAGIGAAISVLGHLLWLIVLLYIVGAVIQFWVAESWRNGLTFNEVMLSLLWFVNMRS
jgi:hypothetical protein